MVVMAMDRARTQWEWPRGLGKMSLDFADMLTMSWVTSNISSSPRNTGWKEIELRASSMLEVEEGA